MDGSVQSPNVQPGQQWARPKDGPWGGYFPPVTIVDVRDGWIRYDMPCFPDQRMEQAAFVAIYQPLERLDTPRGHA